MDTGSLDKKPLLTQDSDDQLVIQPAFGVHSLQGVRATMEDRHTALPHPMFNEECKIPLELQIPRSLFAVFDGHGGHVCAEYAKRNLHKNFVSDPLFATDSFTALSNSVLTTDQKFTKAAHDLKLKQSSGSCAIIAYIERNTLMVANVGDSRAVLCSRGKAVDLSRDHKPDRPDEKQRVLRNGGIVARSENESKNPSCCVELLASMSCCTCIRLAPMRVYPGGLAISRSLGDVGVKADRTVIADPEMHKYILKPGQDEFLILACDGVWDVLSSQAVVDVARRTLQTEKNPTAASVAIAKLALERGSTDNVSVIVITLNELTHE